MAIVDERFVLNEEALDELYAWIDTIPLSRPKKNIARDFSDGVLVAEVVAYFVPKMVDIHNYFSASSTGQKKINWNTLNRRVFSKMGIRISDSTILQLIEAKVGAIEQVLWDLRRKIQEFPPSTTAPRSVARSIPSSIIRSKSPASSTPFKNNIEISGQSSYKSLVPKQQQQQEQALTRDLNVNAAEASPINDLDIVSSSSAQPLSPSFQSPTSPSPRNGSTLASYNHTSQKSHGYVVPPSISGTHNDETSNNNSTCGPPAQIIYRGHKMIPVGFLEEKDREIKALEVANKGHTVKVHRMETLINVKDHRIEDLTHQLHSLRSTYERVTQQTWQGFQ